ncbi:serine/threonine-protein kinase ATG1t-like [Gastrolobium bilobum]|uniref:serine/threonine-protein kinase ATG1t-like n=1 Tax=Gastrolobium bilobum TaxID=150636 RepID=UPI002AAF1F14|nr:serine/threonine-protein kinase ATG1t-like [Gastrolobium bilobum]
MECESKGKLARVVEFGVGKDYYVLKSKIGEGSFSTVWKAEQRPRCEEVAVKQVFLSKLNRHLKDCLDCEINFLSSVKHPNIIRLLHFFQADQCVYLVMEFCAGGNLASYIRCHGRVQQQTAKKFMQQLGSGLQVLHSHGIIHRDLKPEFLNLKKQNKGKGHSDQPIALTDSDKQPMTVNVQAMADSLGDQHQPIASSGGQGLVKQIVLAVEKKSTAREFVIKEHTWQALNGAYHVGGEWEKGISG